MKKSEECQDMQEIRNEIDIIDKNIIDLLGVRFEYVKSASRFKKNEEAVRAPERFTAMLTQRRIWAEENNLSADVVEKMYRDLVGYFIDQELKYWKSQ